MQDTKLPVILYFCLLETYNMTYSHIVIENKVKWYTERKDYNGLKLYIDEKEKFIDNYIINSNNAEEDYIDKLVNDLK